MHSNKQIETLFSCAARIDDSVAITQRQVPGLANIVVNVSKYSRDTLFKNMAEGKVSVFSDFPAPLKTVGQRRHACPADLILDAFYNSDIQDRIRTKSGAKEVWKYLAVADLADKWKRDRAKINVTDFHFRDTSIEDVIDTRRLSRFNLYPCSAEQTSWLEMMTLVVSSSTGFSDSHSDDSDGSNHCFTGKKLWLAWDTRQGLAAGLQDLDQQKISGKCAFDLDTYLSLPSACWFTIESGQTLFMPGHLTHKVLTLEPYLGVGSFYLAFPNLLRTLTRWLSHPSNWERLEPDGYREQAYPELIKTAVKKLRDVDRGGKSMQLRWGADYLGHSIQAWKNQFSPAEKQRLLNFEDVKNLVTKGTCDQNFNNYDAQAILSRRTNKLIEHVL
jgi:hypothetical protein